MTAAEVVLLAKALQGQGRLAEAEQAYRSVLARAPDHAEGLSGLGVLCMRLGRPQEAEGLLRQALAINPRSAEVCNNHGMALAALGRLKAAVAEYDRAVALDPAHAAARNNLGAALHASGRTAEALVHFEAAIGLLPERAEPHNNLGNALAALGRYAEALDCYERALALDPGFAEAHHNLGVALAAMDRADDAIAQFEQALAIAPGYVRAHLALGRVLGARDRYAEAVTHLETALAIGPASAELHSDLGSFLAATKRHSEAVAQFRQACALRPDFAIAHNNLGNALVALGMYREAVGSYKAAFAIDPAFAEAYGNMGSALAELFHPDDAMPYFERALALNPHLAEVHNNRGHAFIALGHMADARDAFERAIALRPDKGDFYRGLAACKRLTEDDPHFIAMESLAQNMASMEAPEQIELHFALARAYEDQRQFEKAFAHFSAGNALRRDRIDYDETTALEFLRRIQTVFGPELMRRAEPRGDRPDVPIFVLGMPRSGSTLVEQVLASHPSVFGAGELICLADEAASLRGPEGGAAVFPDTVRSSSDRDFAELGARYRKRLRALAPAAPRITDKMPANFQLVGLIRLALPDARVIHTRRDPVDTCWSCFAQTFSAGQPFTNDLGELGRYYRGYADLMAHWRRALPEGFMLEVQYEDLVADFEPQARRILDHCGLKWDARCLAFHETRRPILTASATQVREPIHRRSAGRSRVYGRLLEPLLEALAT